MLLFSNEILNPNYNFCQRDMQHFDISVVKYIKILNELSNCILSGGIII